MTTRAVLLPVAGSEPSPKSQLYWKFSIWSRGTMRVSNRTGWPAWDVAVWACLDGDGLWGEAEADGYEGECGDLGEVVEPTFDFCYFSPHLVQAFPYGQGFRYLVGCGQHGEVAFLRRLEGRRLELRSTNSSVTSSLERSMCSTLSARERSSRNAASREPAGTRNRAEPVWLDSWWELMSQPPWR